MLRSVVGGALPCADGALSSGLEKGSVHSSHPAVTEACFATAGLLRVHKDNVHLVAFLLSDSAALLDWFDFLAFQSLLKYGFVYVVNSVSGIIKPQHES